MLDRIAIVIPAYNESATLCDVASRALSQISTVIVVDDGSSDDTAEAVAHLPVVLIRNAENRGKAACLFLGAQEALRLGKEYIITLDGDGQHCPEDIPRLIATHVTHPGSIVIGSRLHARQEIPASRYWANRIANFWISLAANCRIDDTQSGFRLYSCRLIMNSGLRHDRSRSFVFESEILIEASRQGITSLCVPVSISYSKLRRRSHFRPVADIARIVNMVTQKLVRHWLTLQGFTRIPRRRLPRESDTVDVAAKKAAPSHPD